MQGVDGVCEDLSVSMDSFRPGDPMVKVIILIFMFCLLWRAEGVLGMDYFLYAFGNDELNG